MQPLHQPCLCAVPARVPRRHGRQPAGRRMRLGARLAVAGRGRLQRQAYNGPKLELAYWNGFTGGDGPAMQALVKKFIGRPRQDHRSRTTPSSGPTSTSGSRPPRRPARAPTWARCTSTSSRPTRPATSSSRWTTSPRRSTCPRATSPPRSGGPGIYKDKRYGIPLDVHTLAMYYNKDHFEKAGIIRRAHRRRKPSTTRCKKLQAAGIKYPFWMPNQWPAHLMFLSLLWQFGGEPYAEDGSEATYDDEAGVKALELDARAGRQGLQPAERRHRLPVRRVQERQELDHLGRHLADQRPRGAPAPTTASPPCR